MWVCTFKAVQGLTLVPHHVLALECQEKLTAFFVVKRDGYSLGDPYIFQKRMTASW
jgi:hypothetical protein